MTASILLSKIVNFADSVSRRDRNVMNDYQHHDNDNHENRKELRRACNDRLFMQVVQSETEDLVGTTFSCRAVDASKNGLKVTCGQPIPLGCTLDLWVDDSSNPGKFFLSSEVRWVTRDEGDDYHVGVELLEGAATDISAWRLRQA